MRGWLDLNVDDINFVNLFSLRTKNQSEGDAFKCTMDYLLDNVPVNEMSHLIQPEVGTYLFYL